MIQGVLRLNQTSGLLSHQPSERMSRAMNPRVLNICFLPISLQVLGEGVRAERRSTLARPVMPRPQGSFCAEDVLPARCF